MEVRMRKNILLLCVVLLTACGNDGVFEEEYAVPTVPPYIGLVTLAPGYDILDGGLLSNTPCAAPCFLGIEPGKTDYVEAGAILWDLDKNHICNEIDFYDELSGTQVVGWACSNIGVTYNQESGIVNSIRFEPTVPVLLGQVVGLHGKPDTVVVFQNDEYHVQTVDCDVYYFGKNIVLTLGVLREGAECMIDSKTPILTVNYLDEEEMTYYIEVFSGFSVAWKGYGIYP
jgi:hypothetical protein